MHIHYSYDRGVSSYDNVVQIKASSKDENGRISATFTTSNDAKTIAIRVDNNGRINQDEQAITKFKDIMVCEGTSTIYEGNKSTKISIKLDSPLAKLPNGIMDRITKKDGKWVVERNIGYAELKNINGWYHNTNSIVYVDSSLRFDCMFSDVQNKNNTDVISDIIPKFDGIDNDYNGFYIANHNVDHRLVVLIPKNKLKTEDLDGFKDWLNENNPKILYPLNKPIYEDINVNCAIELFNNATYISNDSNIPANMKITVDRVMNRAIEANELAKADPTTENLSNARYWANLLRESAIKDELQEDISNIFVGVDLTMEKKIVTSNVDVYIKSDNTLSMSLDTNSVSFNGYSGAADMEKLGAINIAVNSSLPYSLNAYMPVQLTNADGSEQIPRSDFNIKEGSSSTYNNFLSATDKVVLKADCSKGTNNQHRIDLKLDGNDAYKADLYKGVIKFEAQQK